MTISPETLKTLSTEQLLKLECALLVLASANGNFDAALESIAGKALSATDANLIGSRTYELEVINGLSRADAHKQAMEEFAAVKPKQPAIPRRRPRSETTTAAPTQAVSKADAGLGPELAASPPNVPTAAAPPPAPDNLPDLTNVVPLFVTFGPKCFNTPRHDDVW